MDPKSDSKHKHIQSIIIFKP